MILKKKTLHEDFTCTYLIGIDKPVAIGIFTEYGLHMDSYDFEFEFFIPKESIVRHEDIIDGFHVSPTVTFDSYMKVFNNSILLDVNDPNMALLETVESKFNFITCKTASIEEVMKIIWNTITTGIMNIENLYETNRNFELKSISTTKV